MEKEMKIDKHILFYNTPNCALNITPNRLVRVIYYYQARHPLSACSCCQLFHCLRKRQISFPCFISPFHLFFKRKTTRDSAS